jgi:class 3 adenylate cyclase/tetratricopeptide (TPR) repeat protein
MSAQEADRAGELGLARAAPTRQVLTVVFTDLSDSTRLGGEMEAEHYSEMLREVRAVCQRVIPQHGGTIVRLQGDGLLAIFGHPTPRPDDARRATEAALELHAGVRKLQVRTDSAAAVDLALHTGIHAGMVLLDEGDTLRGRFELLGNVPNLAARLSAVARRGEVVVSAETLGPELAFFETGERELLELRGSGAPIAAHRVLGRAGVATRFEASARRGLAPFVGRERELAQLETLLADVRAGQARRTAIVAPPGVGKTRLADELLRRAEGLGCRVLRGYCDTQSAAEPLQPFAQMLRGLFELREGMGVVEARAQVERHLVALDPQHTIDAGALLRVLALETAAAAAPPPVGAAAGAIGALLERLAAAAPVVLFVDDWQWADRAAREAYAAVCARSDRPILAFVARHPSSEVALDPQAGTEIALAPFDDAEATRAIARLLPDADPFVSAEIRQSAGGNALFLEELCHSVAHGGAQRRAVLAPGSAAWLHALIESRVARLPPGQRELVRAAAIVGKVVPNRLFEAVTGVPADDPRVQALADQDLLYTADGQLHFKHGITRDVVYAAIGLHERMAMHLRVAIAVRGREDGGTQDVELLAYHYGAGGSSGEAAHYAELAGDKAMRASALDRAQYHYRAALEAINPLGPDAQAYPRWMAIVQRLGLACVFDPSTAHLDVLRRAVAIATARQDHGAVAQAEHWLGYILYALGEPRPAIAHCERALLAIGAPAGDALAVQVRATLGQARAGAGQYAQALPLLDEAIRIKQRHRSGSRPAVGLSYTLACKAALLADQGHFDDGHAVFAEALDAVRGVEHEVVASVLGWQCLAYLWQGRWDEALAVAGEAQRVAERVKSQYIYAMNQAMGARAAWCLQPGAAALQSMRDATAWLEAGERRLNISLNHAWLAEALFEGGDPDALRHHAALALARTRRLDRLGQVAAHRLLARAHAADPAASERHLARAFAAARKRGSPHEQAVSELCAAQLAADRGDRAAARARLDPALQAFEALAMHWHLAAGQRLLATLSAAPRAAPDHASAP